MTASNGKNMAPWRGCAFDAGAKAARAFQSAANKGSPVSSIFLTCSRASFISFFDFPIAAVAITDADA